MGGIVKAIGKIFGGGEKPDVPTLPPIPQKDDKSVQDAKKRAREAEKMRKGRRASILTSGSGVSDGMGTSGSTPKAGKLGE